MSVWLRDNDDLPAQLPVKCRKIEQRIPAPDETTGKQKFCFDLQALAGWAPSDDDRLGITGMLSGSSGIPASFGFVETGKVVL